MSLRRALLVLLLLVLTAGVVPAAILLERRVGTDLAERAEADLATAPMVLEERMASVRDVRMMHAQDFAALPGLVEALEQDDREEAERVLAGAAGAVGEKPLLVSNVDGEVLPPAALPPELVEATRAGQTPVQVVPLEEGLELVALAPVEAEGGWIGAAGGSTAFANDEAVLLAGLTRSDVMILDREGRVVASTLDSVATPAAARALAAFDGAGDKVQHLEAEGRTLLVTRAEIDHGTVAFVRDLEEELSLLPDLRRTALLSAGLALLFALLAGGAFASWLARPVADLADAADGFAAGEPERPLPPSHLTEVQRLSEAFVSMRHNLASRLTELERMNEELEDRQARLATLQAELVQRERLAASARLLTLLAHEIRNPVASVRNCLEIVRRKGNLEGEAREFAELAVDELLRMHELAERMLDLHRPREAGAGSCDATAVARETAQLVQAGEEGATGGVSVIGPPGLEAAMPADALKQVLLNLLLNAREASPLGTPVEVVLSARDGSVRIEVLDRGSGISEDALPRLFDPFFTTKDAVHGVGLGLFTAEALVRSAGGSLGAANREDGPGARFAIEIPAA